MNVSSTSLRIGHVSDTHLGFESYQARTDTGHNRRGADLVKAFHYAVDGIIEYDPPLAVHSGDLFESPSVPVRYLLAARSELTRMASVRPDGTRRAVVVISGNHDTSRNKRDGCQLDLFRGQPGLTVVSSGYTRQCFDPADGYDPVLADVVVHALPHDSLRDPELLEQVQPVDGAINILVTHGVAEGDSIFRRMIGREFPIPEDLLVRGWDYAALGHWHTQGPVTIAGNSSFAYYAGSTECVDFSDLRGKRSSTERAWLAVELADGVRTVERRTFPTRTMLALPPIEASGMEPPEVAAALLEQLRDADAVDAVVRQRVSGLTRDLWALADMSAVRAAASECMHHWVEPIYQREERTVAADGTVEDGPDLGDLEALLLARAEEMVPAGDRPRVVVTARKLLGSALGEPPTDPDATDAPTSDTTAASSAGQVPPAEPPLDAEPELVPTAPEPAVEPEPTAPAAEPEPEPEADDAPDVPVTVPAPPADPAAAFASVLGEFSSLATLDTSDAG